MPLKPDTVVIREDTQVDSGDQPQKRKLGREGRSEGGECKLRLRKEGDVIRIRKLDVGVRT